MLFLFVNGKCYGSQLERVFKKPLTPFQKALERLERGGIVTSYYEGKTRLYQWNPAYPLLVELEALLKKAYTLLQAEDRRHFHLFKEENFSGELSHSDRRELLIAAWERLQEVRHLFFRAKSRAKKESGWSGQGEGEVLITKSSENTLLFQEKGTFRSKDGMVTAFTNLFRWHLDREKELISLEHLRRGPEHPVFLFYLVPVSKKILSSLEGHLCGSDAYFGQIHLVQKGMRLHWRVIGACKNEEIDYTYS